MQTPLPIVHLIERNRRQQAPVLDLRGQALLTVPPEIRELTHLQQLLLKGNAIQVLPAWLNDLPQLQFIELNINPLRELGRVRHLVLDWGVWQRLQPAPEQVAGLWLRWEEDYDLLTQVQALPDLRWLDLSEQRLQVVPKWVWKLDLLQILILGCNKLSDLPAAVVQLGNLTQLDLSNNKLLQLPLAITQLNNLTQLDLSGNILIRLPLAAITKLNNLTKLNLSSNQLSSLPVVIGQMCNLTQLDLRNNQLKDLPPSIAQLINLTQLDLRNNQLSELNPAIARLSNLTQLNLGYNRFSDLPSAIMELSNLAQLDLSRNQLSEIMPVIMQLGRLTQLDLSGNKLSNLSLAIAQLRSLTQLNLSGNELSELPPAIAQLNNLTQLNLSYNSFNNMLPVIMQLGNLSQLDLSGNQLSELPPEIAQLDNLTQFNLSYNRFNDLSPAILQLSNLTQLNLSYNCFISLSPDILQLSNLTQLNLRGNQLSELPPDIAQLGNLTQLDLRGNQLSELPPDIAQLDNLTQLDLRNNQLSELPPDIAQLNSLTQLDLRNNQFSELPPDIAQLYSLTQLDLSGNQIRELLPTIAHFNDLRKLGLEENELEIPPLESLDLEGVWGEADITKLRAFFWQAKVAGRIDYIYEAKLILVGEGGAGKTSLARRIQKADSPMPQEEQSTRGIDIEPWIFHRADGKPFRVNIWDFGGQQIYHATHQFFLTKRSLYALLVDTRKEDTVFYEWLNRIELFSEKSPIFIVKNQKDDRKIELDLAELRKRFNNLEQTFDCNIKTNEGREELLNFIRYRIQELPHVGQGLPKSWLTVRELLEADERNYLAVNEYLDICQQHGFKRQSDALQLSDYLHDLGVFLHFQEDDLLRKTVILKPTWATDAVYKVLDTAKVQNQHGYFHKNDLKHIWCEASYADMRPELLQLMMNFYLCYELPKKQEYIVPQLLSKQKPTYPWESHNNLQLRYAYPRFMPSGILIRFIVAIHPMIEAQRRRVWRYGVVLTDGTARAEVREDIERREIRLRFSGKHQRDLLTTLVHELEKIHAPLKKSGLEYHQLVPCNCEVCIYHPEPYFYPYQTLKEFQAEHAPEIQCQKSRKMVNVEGLLNNINDRALQKSVHRPLPDSVSSQEDFTPPQQEPVTPKWYQHWWLKAVGAGLIAFPIGWYFTSFDGGLLSMIAVTTLMFFFDPNRRFFRMGYLALTFAGGLAFMSNLTIEWQSENTLLGNIDFVFKLGAENNFWSVALLIVVALVLFRLDARRDD